MDATDAMQRMPLHTAIECDNQHVVQAEKSILSVEGTAAPPFQQPEECGVRWCAVSVEVRWVVM